MARPTNGLRQLGPLRLTVVGPEPVVLELDPVGHRGIAGDGDAVDLAGPPSRPVSGSGDPQDPPGRLVSVDRLPDTAGGPPRYEAIVDGWRFEIEVESITRAELRDRASRTGGRGLSGGRQVVTALIPGRITGISVAVGDVVDAGHRLLSVEAMKMENAVLAPWPGTIAHVGVVAGQTVERGDELVVIE